MSPSATNRSDRDRDRVNVSFSYKQIRKKKPQSNNCRKVDFADYRGRKKSHFLDFAKIYIYIPIVLVQYNYSVKIKAVI